MAEAIEQRDRWTLWTPVAFGCGIAAYFALKSEPPLWAGVAAVAAGLAANGVAARQGRPLVWIAVVLATFAAAGFLVAEMRTRTVAAPVVPATGRPVLVEGWVVDVGSPGASGGRLLVAPAAVGDLPPERLPVRVRLSVGPEGLVAPGTPVRVLAIMNPPPRPASPGSYDFARDAWFEGVGGVGFALKPPRGTAVPEPGLRLRAIMRLNAMRWRLAERIRDHMAPDAGGIAVAMTTGHEAYIAPEDLEAMRDSGLAHVLSISGLHMAIVGGFVFFGVRLLIAAWPWAALRFPGKKIAAAAGLLAVAAYLALSGAPPPAVRAAVTASVAFGAILADRRAVSLRALALAALLVMLIQPEAVVQPGFQMSFAATAALVALAEAWPRRAREISVPWPILTVQRAAAWVALSVLASFVAGLATGPFAMQHFNRVAIYGLPANLLTAPLSSFVIMPGLALGAALEPLEMGAPFLRLAQAGLEAMTWVAHAASSWPGAVRIVPSAPGAALPVAFLGLLFVCLWRGRLRWAGLPFACAVLLWPREAPPDLWVADDGGAVALRVAARAVPLQPKAKVFATELWSRRRGLTVEPAPLFTCGRKVCTPTGGRGEVAWWRTRKAPSVHELEQLCLQAEVVVVRSRAPQRPPACDGRLVLDAADFARGGSAELWRTPRGWRALWSQDVRGGRAWTRLPPARPDV